MTRPLFVLEGHEDEVYHDQDARERSTEPEYLAFLGRSWVFNRAMCWLNAPDDTLICYSEGGELWLTGDHCISEWFSDPANEIVQDGEHHVRFARRSPRQRDCVVLPALQFNIEQHPLVHLQVTDASTAWQFCVIVKGRSGPPLVAGPWQEGPAEMTFDLRAALRTHGFGLHFAELFFVVGLWSEDSSPDGAGEEIRFSMQLLPSPAIVPCLPVVRTRASTKVEGVPVSAIVLDGEGQRLSAEQVTLRACIGSETVDLREYQGVWSGQLPPLPVGEHMIRLVAGGGISVETLLPVRVTDGHFIAYDPEIHLLTRDKVPLGPLNGSYHGLVHVRDVGQQDEALVQGQAAYEAWDRSRPPGEHWHYWEALTEAELDERLGYLADNGWNLLHLCQHWGLWEKLDAGGRIAPHGAEQVALFYRVAARQGLYVTQALSHYPYGRTPPFRQYLEAGFQEGDWTRVDTDFTARFHQYLADYVTMFREETAIAYLTTSGEGDCAAGVDRVNDTYCFISQRDRNHLFLAEPIFRIDKLPPEYYAGWEQPLFGSRLYWIGQEFAPELDLGVEYKFIRLGPIFMAEGSWPCPQLYADFTDKPRTWIGAPEYRTRVRDSFYMGLVHRVPIMLTWEEQLTEDEHRIVDIIRRQVDWAQPFMAAPVVLRVDSDSVRKRRDVLVWYEEVLSAWPLETQYLLPNAVVPPTALAVIDASKDFQSPGWASEGGAIPDEVKKLMPLAISPEYRASYTWSQDRRTLLAYIYNSAAHLECDYTASLGGRHHRLPRPAPLQLRLQNFPTAPLIIRVYDLVNKTLQREIGWAGGDMLLDFGRIDLDLFVLVVPDTRG